MTNESSKIISLREQTITDLWTVAIAFNIFYSLVGPENQPEVSFSYKMFFDLYHHLTKVCFFFTCTKEEIIKIISNFKSNKSAEPNSIPTKIARPGNDDIFKCLSTI